MELSSCERPDELQPHQRRPGVGFNTMVIFAMSVDANGNFIKAASHLHQWCLYVILGGRITAQCKVTPQVSIVLKCASVVGRSKLSQYKNRIAADAPIPPLLSIRILLLSKHAGH